MARRRSSKTETTDQAAASPAEPAAPAGENVGAKAATALSRPFRVKFGAAGVVWLVAVALLVIGGGYLTWPYLTGATAPPPATAGRREQVAKMPC